MFQKIFIAVFHCLSINNISARELVNLHWDAEDIFGKHQACNEHHLILNLCQALHLVEQFWQALQKKSTKENHPVDEISKLMLKDEEKIFVR